jgi:hypothetical protein
MALSGNFSGKTSNQFVKPTIYWSAVQNLLENYSDVTVELRYSRTNTGYTTQGGFSGAIYIDKGLSTEQKVTGKKSVCTVTYKSNTLAMTAAFRVYHESNGSKSITLSATGSISGTSVESTTISQLITMDTIPRASSIGATDANIGATSMVVVTKKNTAYKHSIAYGFGDLSGYIKADGTATDSEVIFSETSIAFSLPDDFYDQIPNVKSGKCTLTCKTYYGSAQIGENQTVTFTAVAAESVCAPNVSGTVVDVNETTKDLTGDENKLVRYHSKAKCTITASAKNAATLASKTVNGEAIINTLEISNAETGSFTFTANDSRGYSKSAIVKKDLIPYVKLTVNATVKRTDPTGGRAVLTVKGNYYNGGFGAEENSLTLGCQVGTEEAVTLTPVISGNTYTASAELTGLAYDQTFPVTVTARDKLETVTASLTLQKGIPTFDWGEKDFQFHVPVLDQYSTKISNGVAQYSADQIDPNTTLEELILTSHANGPRGSSWAFYIRTIFDSRKSTTQWRTQIAEPYGTAGGVYWRVYSSAGWSAWEKLANATDIADFKVKTYSNLSQLGLSGGVTTGEVFAAMPEGSVLSCDNSKSGAYTNYITDIPMTYSHVVLFKSTQFGQAIATMAAGGSINETYIYDWYKTGSYNGWTQMGRNMVELWANKSPTSTFAAQSVGIDGTKYNCFLILPHVSSNFTDVTLAQAVIAHKGESGHLFSLPNNKISRRKFTINSAGTSVAFESAEYSSTYGANGTDNMYAIPMYIYGMYVNKGE